MSTECAVCRKESSQGIALLICGRCKSRAYCGKSSLQRVVRWHPADFPLWTGADCQEEDFSRHKGKCEPQHYILKVDLLPQFITKPRIMRTLSCPAYSTFAELHRAVLTAFEWAYTPHYQFEIPNLDKNHSDSDDESESIFKITHQNNPDTPLSKFLGHPKSKERAIHYKYDFRSGWPSWDLVITDFGLGHAVGPHFACLEGEGHSCPHDVGGYSGWRELLEAYDAESPTPAQEAKIKWFETQTGNQNSEGLRGGKKWTFDKDKINSILSKLDQQPLPYTSAALNTRHSIILLSLEKKPFFDTIYAEAIKELRSRAGVAELLDTASAIKHLQKALSSAKVNYPTVIATDPCVMNDKYIAVQENLIKYTKAGGTVIFGFDCGRWCKPDKVNRFFMNMIDLGWKYGDYQRANFSQNPHVNPAFKSRREQLLWHQYQTEALVLANAALEDQVFVNFSEDPSSRSSALFAQYGKGYVGWIGDLRPERGTIQVLLSMCEI
ncbi:hypothetical protein G7Y89_g9793 [Cudoniella acicularis]|uniref:Plasmid pRiA4b Orf3-like domain-containing protein n=1 Tax=Cudoniella acicularis TaxID=354080 RepID=A0A8H4RGR9_9HELO|nr:hypothetical protein G7Y89_g9793 [Cudoniella acicularis]